MTSLLQPLDVGVNRPMKTTLRAKWGEWMAHGQKSYTKGGRMRSPDMATITGWVVDCWKELNLDIIRKSFLKCCIRNALDGTEDDELWEDDQQSAESHTDSNSSGESDDGDLYYGDEAELITDEEMRKLFDDDRDTEEFVGFEPV